MSEGFTWLTSLPLSAPLLSALDHVWQSTVVAVVALAAAAAFRRHAARVRCAVLSAALLKFLVPFGMLAALGAALAPARPVIAPPPTIVTQIAQPLFVGGVLSAPRRDPHHDMPFSVLLLAAWMSGAAFVCARWSAQWLHVHRVTGRGTPLTDGRERAAMDALAPVLGVHPLPIVATSGAMAPGVFGIRRPVLLWPTAISARLSDEELRGVLLHELLHVRHRDNLLMAVHLVVQAAFWFHPLVWHLASRAAAERERACDEDVLRLGTATDVYARSILKACRFHIQARPACVAGASGSDLERRITHIMEHTHPQSLRRWQTALLTVAPAAALALPLVLGFAGASPVRAQILQLPGSDADRPLHAVTIAEARDPAGPFVQYFRSGDLFQPGGRWIASNITLRQLVALAYGVPEFRVVSGPSWMGSALFDITVTPPGNPADGTGGGGPPPEVLEGLRRMLTSELALVTHVEAHQRPHYALTTSSSAGAPRLRTAAPCVATAYDRAPCGLTSRPGHLEARGVTMTEIAAGLAALPVVGREVADRTGLEGLFDASLAWTPHVPMPTMHTDGPVFDRPIDRTGRTLRAALVSQLGLELVDEVGPVEVVVVDHMLRPAVEGQAVR